MPVVGFWIAAFVAALVPGVTWAASSAGSPIAPPGFSPGPHPPM